MGQMGLDPRTDRAIYRRESRLTPLGLALLAIDLAGLAACLYALWTHAFGLPALEYASFGCIGFNMAVLAYLGWRHLRALQLAKPSA